MSTETTTRPHTIVAGFIEAFAGRTTRHVDPSAVFERLAQHVAGLEPSELVDAANTAKAIGSELRSLAHRIARAEEHERRRNGPR